MHIKLNKILKILIFLLFAIFLTSKVYASEIDPVEIVGNGPTYSGVSTLYSLGNTILGIMQFISAGVAVIATLVLAIKYMYSSPEEKAGIKKQLIPFIIGGVLVFGAVTFIRLADTYVKEIIP